MKHQPTFTGEEKCPFLLELEWLLHMIMCGVIKTLPAATHPSPVWYATGHRMQRIMRPRADYRKCSEILKKSIMYFATIWCAVYLCWLCEGLCRDSTWRSCAAGSGGPSCRWWYRGVCERRCRGSSVRSRSQSSVLIHLLTRCMRSRCGTLHKDDDQ